jgi:endonuclease-3
MTVLARDYGEMTDFAIMFERLERYYVRLGLTTALEDVSSMENAFQVLISTVISQRNRDEITEKISRRLFKKYPTAGLLARASPGDIERCIRQANFYRTKARAISCIAKRIESDYNCFVPENIEELMKLPLVGRKTANCVLVYAFRKNAIPVDTHVHRISNRIGIVRSTNPEETEKQLREKIPEKYWGRMNNIFVMHGKKLCRSIHPECFKCPISEFCKYAERNATGRKASGRSI